MRVADSHWPSEFFTCRVCGINKPYSHTAEVHMGVCMGCAEPIANHFWKGLGGKWLTWDEDTVSRRPIKEPIPSKLRWEVFKRDGYRCLECDSKHDLTADHILAESRGGPATLENLQTLCRPCNSRKGAA
jgi:hypothetical protein